MKKILFALFLFFSTVAMTAPVFNAPAVRIQPNGDTLRCLLSGDEYYHRLHDADGFTIIQNPANGFWVYATTVATDRTHWQVVPTDLVAGVDNPAEAGLSPNVGPDDETWQRMQHRLDVPKEYSIANNAKTSGRNHGTLNNIVIFIRFSDETEITTPFSTINNMFNDTSANATSMCNYFRKASYGKINILTHYYPTPSNNTIISFQDSLPRSYYMPYDSASNTNGYSNDTESRLREFSLLERAVNYVNANYPVSSSLNIDMDNDGYVDNICFVLKGTYTGWSDLLWPHKWSLYDRQVYINNKRVYTFNLQLEGSGSHYFSSSTFCHEMFHTLGAPDLYRYNVRTNVSGVGSWDLMCSNTTPPQHMSAYMKYKYGNWLDSIPEITVPGTYTLHSLADPDYSNCAYRIAAQEPHQWYVLEYRDNTEMFETTLPGRGLLVFRIDDRYNGNASYNGTTVFDEVYLFRPNALNDSTNGTLAQAYFSGNTSRTSFTPNTNPHPWLTGNVIDSTFSLSNITSPGTTISFTYVDLRGCRIPMSLASTDISGTSATLSWNGNSNSYRLEWRQQDATTSNSTIVNTSSTTLTGLSIATAYQWRVMALCSNSDSSIYSEWQSFTTEQCIAPQTAQVAASDTTLYSMPVNNYYKYTYTQMIYLQSEVGGPLNINALSFNYAGSNGMTEKDNCVIYLANTSQSSFTGTNMNNFVPFSQLTKVYEGPLFFTNGWNTVRLDSTFQYNGTDNLVVAIDDNSNDYDGSSYKFYCSKTGNNYRTLTYYSDNNNIDPSASTNSASKGRRTQRPDIRFIGCSTTPDFYTIVLDVDDAAHGTVSGGGIHMVDSIATVTATANHGYSFAYWTSDGDTILLNPYSFTVTADRSLTAHFSAISYSLTINSTAGGSTSGAGTYSYGTTATIEAFADAHYSFVDWTDLATGNTFSDNPYSFNVDSDRSFLASFQIDKHNIHLFNGNNYGSTYFTVDGSDEQLHDATLDYGTRLTLYAVPRTDITGTVCEFVTWNDGNSDNPRQLTLTQDTVISAKFTTHPVGITELTELNVTVEVDNLSVSISGAAHRTIELFDITGRALLRTTGTGNDHLQLPTTGIYLLRIDGFASQKIVAIK